MKYNIGDSVFKINNIQFFDNHYHWKAKMNSAVSIVKEATEDHFSIYKNGLDSWAGTDRYRRCSQITGESFSYPQPDIYLHIEKDRIKIIQIINDCFHNAHDNEEKRRVNEINKLESKISRLQDELKLLREGKQNNIFGNPAFDWLNEQKEKALELLQLSNNKGDK